MTGNGIVSESVGKAVDAAFVVIGARLAEGKRPPLGIVFDWSTIR